MSVIGAKFHYFYRYSIAFNLISHIVVTISAAIKQRYNSDEATVNELIAKHRKDAPK